MAKKIDNQLFTILLNLGFTCLTCGILLVFHIEVNAQNTIEPPHWFADMPNEKLEILIHKKDIGHNTFEVQGQGVKLESQTKLPNKNYILLTLILEGATPQFVTFRSKGKAGKYNFKYELKKREKHERGLDLSDVIYLITPDRFANGDSSNDSFENLAQTGIDRAEPYARHGGDIRGIIDHLDYIQELGMTAIWPSPLLENDQPKESYHGYAITDHFQIDPRFGNLELYRELKDSLENRNMKLIMDVVYNHIGDHHHLYQDIPDSSWFHFFPSYRQTNYRAPSLMDPYASEFDKTSMTDGWFDKHMPDLDQKNSHVANYLIQQTIWWIEEFRIEALRIDTYAYPDQDFMRQWAAEVKRAFPDIFLFAETWVHGTPVQAWFLGSGLGPEENNINSLTDFQIYYAINDALTQDQSWTGGVSKIYYTLAADYVYDNPKDMVTFLDNHDLARFFGYVNRDMDKFKMGVGLLFTLRGIPSLYYGTEILMSETDGHGKIRQDFPGGWPTDSISKFDEKGRTQLENEAFKWIKDLTQFRNKHIALQEGKTTQYVPVKGLYIFIRHTREDRVMIALNTSGEEQTAPLDKFQPFLNSASILRSITGEEKAVESELKFPPKSISIYALD